MFLCYQNYQKNHLFNTLFYSTQMYFRTNKIKPKESFSTTIGQFSPQSFLNTHHKQNANVVELSDDHLSAEDDYLISSRSGISDTMFAYR